MLEVVPEALGVHVAVAGAKRLFWLYDITPLRRAEQARLRSERRLAEAIESNAVVEAREISLFETIVRRAAARGDIKDAAICLIC